MSALYTQVTESPPLPDLPTSFPECLRISDTDFLPSAPARRNDAALQPFLDAETEQKAQRCLEALTRQAAPIIARIVRQVWHTTPNRAGGRYQKQEEQEADDIYQDAMTLLIARLRALRSDNSQRTSSQSPIARYSAYVAATASHVCHERLRRAHPNRQTCRDRLRYLLTSVPALALWRDDWGRTVCGLSDWQGRPAARAALLRLHTFQENLGRPEIGSVSPLSTRSDQDRAQNGERLSQERLTEKAFSKETPLEFAGKSLRDGTLNAASLTCLLKWLGGPVTPQHLTTALIGVLRVEEMSACTPSAAFGDDADAQTEDALANVEDRRVNVAQEVEEREFLRRLWREVTHLPPLQRVALLLNLRDGQGRGALALLAHTHTASAEEIAASLPLPAETLADAWPALPLEDARIAQMLGMTRQQVINLRKVARARLTRRLREQQ